MHSSLRHMAMLVFFLLLPLFLGAQKIGLSVSVDTAHLRIGEQVTLSLEVKSDTPLTVLWPPASPEWAPFEPVRDSTFAEQVYPDSFVYRKDYILAAFDSGQLHIPSMPLPFSIGGATWDTLHTPEIPVTVDFIEVDTSGAYRPIKPLISFPRAWTEYLPWYIAAFLLLLLVAFVWWWRKRKKKTMEPLEKIDTRPAHVIALEKLEKLELEALWQKGEVKEYHDRVSDIVREYIEKRFGIPALESTSDELLTFMSKTDIRQRELENLKSILTIADIVKFARGLPTRDQNVEVMERARAFIEETKAREEEAAS